MSPKIGKIYSTLNPAKFLFSFEKRQSNIGKKSKKENGNEIRAQSLLKLQYITFTISPKFFQIKINEITQYFRFWRNLYGDFRFNPVPLTQLRRHVSVEAL